MNTEGVYYKRCEFDFRIHANGAFSGRFYYHVINDSPNDLHELPSEGWIWFESPETADINYRIVNHERATLLRKMSSEGRSIAKALINLLSKEPYEFRFNHKIEPPLRKGEGLEYELTVRTENTENESFSREGTYWGFPAIFPIESAKLTLSAPPGYEIEVTKPVIIWNADRTENQPEKEIKSTVPELNRSKTMLTWELSHVGPGDRYWLVIGS